MDRCFRQGIYDTVAEVFETVFLIPLERMEDGVIHRGIGETCAGYFEVRIDLLNGCRSPAFFFFPAGLVKEIAGDFLGLDGEVMALAELTPVAKMAAKMTMGGLLARVDPRALIRAGEPRSRSIENFVPRRLFETPGAWVYKTGRGYMWVDVGRIEDVAAHC